jgi:proline racemase
MSSLLDQWSWKPPINGQKITTIDTHTGGEPMRIFISSSLPIQDRNVLEKRQYFLERYDHVHTGLVREPRGHADMYAAVVTPSEDDADLDVVFLNTGGCAPMCGQGVLAIMKVMLESRIMKSQSSSSIHHLVAQAPLKDGEVRHASFRNVPSFVYLRD